jgi:hypothetical protein
MTSRACQQCGRQFDAIRDTARFCSDTCRKRQSRAGVVPALPENVVELGVVQADEPAPAAGTYAATLAELEACERADTPLGQAALALARRIDLAADTGSGLASAVKALTETLAAATRGAARAETALDRVRARRDAKRQA